MHVITTANPRKVSTFITFYTAKLRLSKVSTIEVGIIEVDTREVCTREVGIIEGGIVGVGKGGGVAIVR
jgi:hypothetical protein